MRQRTMVLSLLAGLIMLGLAASVVHSRPGWLSGFVAGAADGDQREVSIAAGRCAVYELNVRASQSAPNLPGVSGTIALRAQLEFDLEKVADSRGSALFRLIPTTPAVFSVLDAPLLSAAEAKATIAGRVTWNQRLALERLEVTGNVGSAQTALLRALFRQIFAADQCASGASHIDVELGLGVGRYALGVEGSQGRSRRLAALEFAVPGSGSDTEQLLRHAEGSIVCEAGLPVTLLEDSSVVLLGEERAVVARVENALSLRLVRTGSGARDEAPVPMRKVDLDVNSAKQSLESRAQGLTVKEVIADLNQFANAGRMLNTPRWMWQATARLALEPRYLSAVGDLLRQTEMVDSGRAFVVDVLAFTPAPEAQEVLRRVLFLPPAGVDTTEYALLVQRFAFIAQPTVATLAWLDTLRRADPQRGPVFQAATLALGSAIGKPGVPAQERSRYVEAFLDELARFTDEELVACELRAIGNTALLAPLAAVRSRSSHRSALVRAAVASALRHASDSTSRDLLVSQVEDAVPFVVRHALHSLRLKPLTARNYGSLARAFQSLPRTVHDDAVSFLAARRSQGIAREEREPWRKLVAVLLLRAAGNGALESRLSELLDS